MRSCEVSGKLEIRKCSRQGRCKRKEKKKEKEKKDLKKEKEKKIVKHKRGIVIILTFEFE